MQDHGLEPFLELHEKSSTDESTLLDLATGPVPRKWQRASALAHHKNAAVLETNQIMKELVSSLYDAGVPGDQLMMWIREAAGDIKRKDGDDISSAVHSDGTSTVPHPQMRQTASPTAALFSTEVFDHRNYFLPPSK